MYEIKEYEPARLAQAIKQADKEYNKNTSNKPQAASNKRQALDKSR
jgi:hypothetical protein